MKKMFFCNPVLYIILIWLVAIGGNELLYRHQLKKIKQSWPGYRDATLRTSFESIQQQFNQIERTSFGILDSLLQNTQIINNITYWKAQESRTAIFEALYNSSHHLQRRGIAIYNHLRQCIAWKNCDFNPAPRLLDECLAGERFSTVEKSGKGVFVVLCNFVPIPHPKLREYVGVAVSFFSLDTNYPLSTRYIKSQSFANNMLQKYALQNIQINYDNTPIVPKKIVDGLQGPLQNLNGQSLGWITLKSLPKNITLNLLKENEQLHLNIINSILILFLSCFLLLKLNRWKGYSLLRCGIGIGVILVCRHGLHRFNCPAFLLPDFLNVADIFHSLSMGEWSDSLGNLLVSSLAIFLVSVVWYKWAPKIIFPSIKIWQKIVGIVMLLAFTCIFNLGNTKLYQLISAIVQHASFQLFDLTTVIPSTEVLFIYTATLLLGLFLFFIALWLVDNSYALLLRIFSKKWSLLFLLLLFFLPGIIQHRALWSRYTVYLVSLLLAIGLKLLAFPKRYILRWIFIVAFIATALFPHLIHASRYKIRYLVEDRAQELQEQFTRDTLEFNLEIFAESKELTEALLKNKSDIAFLLWAKSPLAERLDNLDLQIYVNTTQKNKKIAQTSHQKPHFRLLSRFAFNMPNRLWYQPLLDKLNYLKYHSLESLPGYGNEGKNNMFYVGGVPIKHDGQPLGYLSLITRYPQISQPFPLPEVFSKKPPLSSSPLLMADFRSHTMFDSSNPYIAKDFKPRPELIALVEKGKHCLWQEEVIDECHYDNFYFLRLTKTWGTNQQQTVTRRDIGMLGYPLPSKLTQVFYFLQFFLSGLIFLVLPFFLFQFFYKIYHRQILFSTPYFSFEHKLILSFFIISAILVIVMGELSQAKATKQIWEGYSRNLTEYMQNAEKAIREETFLPLTVDELTTRMPNDRFCQNWGERNRRMLNVYLASPPLILASNRRELFYTELLPRRISGKAYYQLMLKRKDIYITLESIGDYKFVVGYKALTSALDKRIIVGAMSIPMIYRQAEVQREITETIATVFTIYVVVFIIVVLTGIILAHQITKPLTGLLQATHQVSAGKLDVQIPIVAHDEFGQLIESFNRMTQDLKHSREKLVEAEKDAAWREMSRQIAHEIKNPLTPMKLSAQHIQRAYNDQAKSFDKILNKGITTIIDAIDSLSKTASTFSEFARFTKPHLAPNAVEPLLKECLNLFSHYAQQNIVIQSHIDQNLPPILSDSHQLKRVIINILTNAVQSIKKEHGRIILVCKQNNQEANKIIITIRDNGSGIPESIKPHLFEPNFSTKSHGSGLGLAICKRAINHMEGTISIESEEEKGTLVTIELHCRDGHVPVQTP